MTQSTKRYRIHQVPQSQGSPDWAKADVADIDNFHQRSSSHHPNVQARLLHDGQNLLLRFDVQDRYMICRQTEYQSSVCGDSCVEFFVQPRSTGGYFNFEINSRGTMLLMYIEDPTRDPDGKDPFKKMLWVPAEWGKQVKITSSEPNLIPESRDEAKTWWLEARIPLSLIEHFYGPAPLKSGETWRANFYKCADQSSHPHWGSWSFVGDPLSFHRPETFGDLEFA